MQPITAINDFVVRFANVNGTGSASANTIFAKSIFRMGIPVSAKNIFPSNIQGLPTWYEVRVSEAGWLCRRGGVDLVLANNPQSMAQDIQDVLPGGYFFYDSSKRLDENLIRRDISYIGMPLTELCLKAYEDPRQRQLFKNIMYVGALAALLNIDTEAIKQLLAEQFADKPKLVPPNVAAMEMGFNYAKEHFTCPLGIRVERRNNVGNRIMIDGNSACALGAVYGGATVMAWYPITPSTSVAEAFHEYCEKFRVAPDGTRRYAFVQAEDEISAIGIVIGASWNGARAFTATSGPGVSLMTEFLGLAYFAEIPAVIVDVQRAGPSTGMPTRTQQADILAAALASHGDTKHVLLFPSTPAECFLLTADAFDLAEQLQTPVFVMMDLDLGMNEHLSEPFTWDDKRTYKRGKVLTAEQLENMPRFGRYLDTDNDGITYRTLPGTHPTKGAYFTRGTSRDEYALYTENGDAYVRNMDRLLKKWNTAKTLVPKPQLYQKDSKGAAGVLFFGTTTQAAEEALFRLHAEGIRLDALRLRAFPFTKEVVDFIQEHDLVYVIEQNRDAQMRSLLLMECGFKPEKLVPLLNYDGSPITAKFIADGIRTHQQSLNKTASRALPKTVIDE
jgi:2-oxoglutarate ferredoxin oxidoreductase subunit alpha